MDRKVGVASFMKVPEIGAGETSFQNCRARKKDIYLQNLSFYPILLLPYKYSFFQDFCKNCVGGAKNIVPLSIHTLANRSYVSALLGPLHTYTCVGRSTMYMMVHVIYKRQSIFQYLCPYTIVIILWSCDFGLKMGTPAKITTEFTDDGFAIIRMLSGQNRLNLNFLTEFNAALDKVLR